MSWFDFLKPKPRLSTAELYRVGLHVGFIVAFDLVLEQGYVADPADVQFMKELRSKYKQRITDAVAGTAMEGIDEGL